MNMIQNKTTGFSLFRRAKIIKAFNPVGLVVIRLLLLNDKYYWVAMMDFMHSHDTYYVGKNKEEAIEAWKAEGGLWGDVPQEPA